MKALKWLMCMLVVLAGCTFNGTKPNYTELLTKQSYKLELDSDRNIHWLNTNVTIDVADVPSGTDLTAEMHTIKFSIESPFRINMDTLDKALKFYQATGTAANEVARKGKELVATRKTVDDISNKPNVITVTEITYDVDFSGVTAGSAFFEIDAELLQDLYGNYILNENKNEKAGEKTVDNYVRWIDGTSGNTAPTFYKPGTNPAIALDEACKATLPNPCPFVWDVISGGDISIGFPGMDRGYAYDSTGKALGSCYIAFPQQKHNGTDVDDWTKVLNKMYAYEVLTPGSTQWEKKTLSFKHTDSEYGLTGVYVALTEPYKDEAAGTKVRFVRTYTKLADSDSPAYVKTKYGAPVVLGTSTENGKVSRIEITPAPDVVGVYTKDPGYIINGTYFSTLTNSDLATNVFTNPVTLDEDDLLVIQKYGTGYVNRFEVKKESDYPVQFVVKLSSASDNAGYQFVAASLTGESFIITDNHNKKLSTTVSPIFGGGNKGETKADGVRITLTGDDARLFGKMNVSTLATKIKLWIGSVEITKGEDASLRTQKFGKYKDATDGDASGYVELSLY